MIEYELGGNPSQDKEELLLEDCLTFNELIIMSQMMINLVNYECAKIGGFGYEDVDQLIQGNIQFCESLYDKINGYLSKLGRNPEDVIQTKQMIKIPI